ncbi:LysR family transcriptional regulator [Streptomyces sp. NPDC058657]|uniref:LysR family transcriptional regulator n=1 Tax=unclassified Streptomyces TaxID=2593676 RepID=UPI003660233A
MERDELECFLLLAEELHFGRTADRMRLSRARVSQLVQRLERRVGAPLFVRTSRRVALTALGKQLRTDLEPHHRAIDAALARAVESARGVGSTLFVGFSSPLGGEIVLKAADVLRERHPEMVVEICEIPFSDPYGSLRSGQFDLQLTEFPARESDLRTSSEPLLTEERVLAVSAGHPFAARAALSVEDLAEVALMPGLGALPDYWQEFLAPTRTPGGREIPRAPAVTHMQEALVLVAAGKGALLAPAHAATYYRRPGIAYVPFVDAAPVGHGLVWRTGDETQALRAFARTAAEVARSRPEGRVAAFVGAAQ